MQPSPTSLLLDARSRRTHTFVTLCTASLLVSIGLLSSCREAKVASYRVPKESAAALPATKAVSGMPATPAPTPVETAMPAAAAGSMPADSHGLQTAAGTGLAWTAPATWQSKVGSAMRKATYVVNGEGGATADLAISAFPGDVGGEAANVNRWRGQVGLEPISEASALTGVTRLEANGLKIGVVDVTDGSGKGTRLLGAWVPFEGATWFFKLLGPDPLVAKEKPAFLAFLQTIKPAAPARP